MALAGLGRAQGFCFLRGQPDNIMDIIKIESIAKSYGKHQVHKNLDLSIRRGECFTLLGPSGCGKTVLLRLIAGFETPDSGKISIGETVVSDPGKNIHISPDSRGIGMVFQDYAVWPHMTVFDNVAYPLKLAQTPKDELTKRVMETIGLTGMSGLEKRLPSELSGGQQQRVALARALVARPSLMLLDEPLSNLDANLREEMRFEIKELQHKLDITVLYVTHDQEVALAISDRIAIMDGSGRVRQTGAPWEIFEQPADPFVFNFMGIANFVPVHVSAEREGMSYRVGNGTQVMPWIPPTDSTPNSGGVASGWVAGFRPSDVEIAREGVSGEQRSEGLRGVVRRASFLGAMIDYLIEVDGASLRTALETHEALSRGLMFDEGESCVVSFRNLLWFDAGTLSEVKS
ncbi:MAG: ABC transporter ATP-binding protein [Synergistaceae bacterium]|jgi:iron(III) transport system ATP-binding protein|nr:ABC transporter ATP-binding protein [Synergistaceae bacterium]